MKLFLQTAAAFLFFNSAIAQVRVSGVIIPPTAPGDKEAMTLNGAGVREKYFMDMYVCALYLQSKSSDENAILDSDAPVWMKIQIVSGMVSTKAMQSAVEEGFNKSTGGKTAPLRADIDKFISAFNDPITKGDVFDIVYIPGKGCSVYKNGSKKVNIPNPAFRKPLYGIWIGKEPAQSDLKKALLGK